MYIDTVTPMTVGQFAAHHAMRLKELARHYRREARRSREIAAMHHTLPVEVNGVAYESSREAQRMTGIAMRVIRQRALGKLVRWKGTDFAARYI